MRAPPYPLVTGGYKQNACSWGVFVSRIIIFICNLTQYNISCFWYKVLVFFLFLYSISLNIPSIFLTVSFHYVVDNNCLCLDCTVYHLLYVRTVATDISGNKVFVLSSSRSTNKPHKIAKFQSCIVAIDSTHIKVRVLKWQRQNYRSSALEFRIRQTPNQNSVNQRADWTRPIITGPPL